MKLQQNTNTVVRSGSFEESNYTIEASAKAFSILSDGLYANKIEAAIRELSTNAYDAHVDAGCPQEPFSIPLPNRFEPTFLIRDYGTGLSHDDCMNLYTTYFGSNKTNTNDAVGCLGLGSKSPFAYTDSFLVTSFFNGKKRVYNSYKNEHDEPVFALLSEEDTTDRNGMEVSFSVEQDDIEEFDETAQKIYRHFKVRPVLTDNDNTFEIENEVEYVVQGSNWGIVKSEGYSRYSEYDSAIAIMGQVAYPVDSDQFDGEDVEALLKSDVHIHFAIGELDITPSREALSYNEYTKKAIKTACECILLEMKEVIEESFDECETMFEARMKYYKLSDSGNILNRVVGIFDKSEVTWNDVPLWGEDTRFLRVTMPESMEDKVRNIFRDDWRKAIRAEHVEHIRFDHRKEMHFVFDDLKRGGLGRTKNFIKSKVGEEKYSSHNKDMAYLFTGGITKEEVIEALQCKESDLILTSTLPSPTKSRGYYYSGEARTKVALWNEGRRDWEDVEVDMSEGEAFYVEINRYEIINCGKNGLEGCGGDRVHSTPTKIYNTMIELGYDFGLEEGEKPTIYGVKSQEVKKAKFNKDGNWTNLLRAAEKCYENAVPEQLEWREDYNYWQKAGDNREVLNKIIPSLSNVPSVMANYIEDCKVNKDRQDWVNAFCSLARIVDESDYDFREYNCRYAKHFGKENRLEWDEVNEANPYPAKWEKVMEGYPMMELLLEELCSWGMEAKHIDAIVDYIKMVDRCKNIDSLLR